MAFMHDRLTRLCSAGNRKASKWNEEQIWWSEFVERLKIPSRSKETLTDYFSYKKSQQDDLKDRGGYVYGVLKDGRRKASAVTGRDVLTLDLDNIPAGGTQDVLRRVDGLGCGYCIYSTRKHCETAPRLRVLIPLNRTVTADEYEPIARKTAGLIGIELCDKTTFEASRLMYWPSCCCDSAYVYTYGDKPFLYADGVLGMYGDWHNTAEWPQCPGVQEVFHRLLKRQEDPTAKSGIVGMFCRTYDIYRAIDEFIPSEYTPTDIPDRYTYAGGSTTGGAVIYDNGLFLYSHHATDPCSGKLVNAFDLVRLHKFGHKDNEAKPDTPANKLPSFVAMCEFAVKDTCVAALLNAERYQKAVNAFAIPQNDDGDNSEVINWMSLLAVSPNSGQIQKTTDNMLIILENDPLLKEHILYDEFAKRGIAADTLPWDLMHPGLRTWNDNDDKGVRWYLEKTYGITGKDKISDALGLCGNNHSYNEVKDYLNSLKWDGISRLDTLFIDYLGAADNAYVKAVTRKAFAAAVARVLDPGCKYDTMPILTGPQGIGKSTLLNKMGRKWFTDSLKTFEGKEAAEIIQGVWIVEIGELAALNRAENERVKQFISQRIDRFRAAYGRHVQEYPRCCVFFGTSNNSEFLRDTTGGRRFWPVDAGIMAPTKNVFKDLDAEIDMLWAEAVMFWRLGEVLYLSGELESTAREEQEQHRERSTKEGIILDFLEQEVPEDWSNWELTKRLIYWQGGIKDDVRAVVRTRVCALEVWCEALGNDPRAIRNSDAAEINNIIAMQKGWKRIKKTSRFGYCKMQRGFERQ